MATIQNNLLTAFARRQMSHIQTGLSESARRLSSGLRINRAADDGAGLGIAEDLQKQTRSVRMSGRNAQDAISVLRTADGGLGEITNVLHRIKQLTTEASNASLSTVQRKSITSELKQLKSEINAIAENTRYNGFQLLTGSYLQAVKGEFVTVSDYGPLGRSALTSSTFGIGAASLVEASKSQVQISNIRVTDADPGTFSLATDGAKITLTKTTASNTLSQSLTLVSEAPLAADQVLLNNRAGGTTTLNFSDLGVEIDILNLSVGLDHTPESVANKIGSIGPNINGSIQNAGWTAVTSNNLATGGGELRVIVSSSAGELRLTDTTGLQSVFGYAALGSSSFNISSGKYQMAFIGSADEVNAALRTLQVNSTSGVGTVEINITSQIVSPDSYVGNLEPAIAAAQQEIIDYLQVTTPQTLFGLFNGGNGSASTAWLEAAQQLKSDILNRGYSVNLKAVSDVEIGGALGAFAESGVGGSPTIFLNQKWIEDGATVAQIRNVIIQEVGHAIDARLNTGDTAGDEGDAFASAVLGTPYNDGISDSGSITVGGVPYAVEFAQLSVPFPQGFIGTVGSSNNAANNIRTFATLGITKASFFQNSSGATFVAQGNDIPGGVRLQLSSGQVIEVNGTINWRHTQGSTLYAFGFIPSPGITPISFSYGAGLTYTINSSSNFGLKLIGAAYNYTDAENISGNAATNGLLEALNGYLATIESSNPNGPVSVNAQTTADTTPTLTGSATLAAGETLSVTVGGKTYTTSSGLTFDSGTKTWSLTLPDGDALAGGTYDITATITNASGYTLTDSSSAELVITAGDSTPPTISLSSNLANLGAGNSAIITFTLSESSTDFSLADIILTTTGGNATGTLSNFTGSGSSYSVTFTPSNGVTGTVKLSVASGAFTDAANNANADGADANNSVSLTIDTSAVSVSVSGTTVSESSPYAMFKVSLSAPSTGTVVFTPTLLSDTATVGTDTGSSLEYFNGTSWVSAAGGVTMSAGQTEVLLRVAINNDASYEGSELFSLSTGAITGTGSVTNSSGASGSSTIRDDGSTTNTFASNNNTFSPTAGSGDNDSGLAVGDITVNENSPYAIFTVSGQGGQQVALDLTGISAIEDIDGDRSDPTDDFGPVIEYWNGSSWVTYDPTQNGGYITIPPSGTLLVRTAVIDDTVTEGELTFSLTVTPSAGGAVTGIATINDQGLGTIYTSDPPNTVNGIPIAPVNDLLAKDNDLIDKTTTINLSSPATIEVGGGLQITNVDAGGTGSGVYKLVASDERKTATLYHYDLDGTTLLGSEEIDISDNFILSSNESRLLIFSRLGVVLTLENLSFGEITIGTEQSGLQELVTVAFSRLESSIGEGGFIFQTGERARRSDFTIDAFRDIRVSGNTDSRYREMFNLFGSYIDAVDQSGPIDATIFQTLHNLTDGVLESVVRKRVAVGAMESRLLYNIEHLDLHGNALTSALSAIRDVDYASETARLAKQQILQQATTAMLAQANILPNVVLSLLTHQAPIDVGI